MTQIQEMVMTLFAKDTISKVKEQFSSGKEIVPIDSSNMSFRLFKPSMSTNINLEILIQMPLGLSKENDFLGNGIGHTSKSLMFFKPIGFFTQKKGFLSTSIELTIIGEFENELSTQAKQGNIPSNIMTNKLTLEENAVIAAFSMEALLNAQKYEDATFIANGLYCELIMTLQGYPQFFLDDQYNLNEPIAAFLLREKNSINPVIKYKELFDKFNKMSLMTAFKKL